jgi:holo-[acyl-carrier protein] synthase
MIAGVGTDIVEIERMERLWVRYGARLARRMLCEREQDALARSARPGRYLAKQFAAKEAVAKALGTGFRRGVSLRRIPVLRAPSGQPFVDLAALASLRPQEWGDLSAHVSIADEDGYAVAFAVLERPTPCA